ncbi:MAG: hypothetical protein AB7G13_33010 [Lautropia sp.]
MSEMKPAPGQDQAGSDVKRQQPEQTPGGSRPGQQRDPSPEHHGQQESFEQPSKDPKTIAPTDPRRV